MGLEFYILWYYCDNYKDDGDKNGKEYFLQDGDCKAQHF